MITDGRVWECPHSKAGCFSSRTDDGKPSYCFRDWRGWVHLFLLEAHMKGRLTKPKNAERPVSAGAAWTDKDFFKDYPTIHAFLTEGVWDDGSHRETGTLLLFTQDGQLKLCLNDRAMNRSAFLTATTFALLFELAEEKLSDDSLDWRTKK